VRLRTKNKYHAHFLACPNNTQVYVEVNAVHRIFKKTSSEVRARLNNGTHFLFVGKQLRGLTRRWQTEQPF